MSNKIGWCTDTVNPVVGCLHDCLYCYAEKMNFRFRNKKGFAKDFKKPEFFPEKMKKVYSKKKPQVYFVGSMSDPAFWGAIWWVKIMKMCADNPQHTFMFLTKNPRSAYSHITDFYSTFNMKPQPNVIFGFTEDFSKTQIDESLSDKLDRMNILWRQGWRVFISIEPLLGKIPKSKRWGMFETIIVGAMTGAKAIEPKKSWIDSIKNNLPIEKVFLKDNIKKIINNGACKNGD